MKLTLGNNVNTVERWNGFDAENRLKDMEITDILDMSLDKSTTSQRHQEYLNKLTDLTTSLSLDLGDPKWDKLSWDPDDSKWDNLSSEYSKDEVDRASNEYLTEEEQLKIENAFINFLNKNWVNVNNNNWMLSIDVPYTVRDENNQIIQKIESYSFPTISQLKEGLTNDNWSFSANAKDAFSSFKNAVVKVSELTFYTGRTVDNKWEIDEQKQNVYNVINQYCSIAPCMVLRNENDPTDRLLKLYYKTEF